VGTGYTALGQALANKAVTQDDTGNLSKFDADDVSWTTATITARYAILWRNRGGVSSADELIGYWDLGSNVTCTGGTFLLQWDTDGIINMTGTSFYNSAKQSLNDGTIDLDTDDIYAALCTNAYTMDQDLHDFFDDITNEVSGTGYTAGGQALTGKSVAADNTDNEGYFTSDAITWANASITARYLIFYKKRGGASSLDDLISCIDLGADKTSSGGNFVITPNAEGWFNANQTA